MAQTDSAGTEIIKIVTQYTQALREAGLPVMRAILFGSFAQQTAHADSDIDVLIISPAFDKTDETAVDLLWELRAVTDARIEPVACGQKQWETDRHNWLLHTARNEGIVVA
jgi:uncharacterized protein